MITHIFSDLDGTLLNEQSKVTEETITTIKKANIPFSLVSARTPNDMAPIVTAIGSNAPHVSFNGALIYKIVDNQRVILYENPLNWTIAQKIITAIQIYFPHISFSFYDEDNWYTCRIDEGIQMEKSIGYQTPQLVDRQTFFSGQSKKIFKIMLWVLNPNDMIPLQEFLNSIGIEDITVVQSGEKTLEITHKESTKSKGIDTILTITNADRQKVAAFGDGHNDIPMLKAVGVPIVMENATDDIKIYGKYITKSNRENGVSYGIKHYLLK